MAELIPMYHWNDRAEWHLLEALRMVSGGKLGWARQRDIWEKWQICCRWTGIEGRGQSLSTCREKLRKFERLGWVEKKTAPGIGVWWQIGNQRVELETTNPGIYWFVDGVGTGCIGKEGG